MCCFYFPSLMNTLWNYLPFLSACHHLMWVLYKNVSGTTETHLYWCPGAYFSHQVYPLTWIRKDRMRKKQ